MRDGAESFALADRTFFDWPGNWDLEATRFPAPPLPDGWTRDDNEAWTFCRPPQDRLPDQGWKIHVSASPDDAPRTIADVADYCARHGIAFKYLKSANVLRALSRKYAQRSSAGKLLTVYPADDAELARTLEGLDALIGGRPGPYVLTDLRFRQGPLYVRYGGFRTRYVEDADGELVTAFRRPDGTLEPDRRTPVFHTPDWVTVPDVLKDSLAARQAVDDFPYRITGALHFSHGGGVYRAEPAGEHALGAGQRSVVLKEGRPYSGTDGVGRDAIARLAHEHRILTRLAGLPGIPRTFGTFQAGEHLFLVLEDIEGQDFQSWLAGIYPLTVPEPDEAAVAAHRDRALALFGRIEQLIASVHDRGVRIGDLHPGNFIIQPGDVPVLLDFEVADGIDLATPSSLGAPGFHRADATGADGDHYALAAIALWLFLPLAALGGLAPDKASTLLDTAARRFGLPGHLVSRLAPQLAPNDNTTSPLRSLPETFPPSDLLTSIDRGLRDSATPHRTDRLHPGDFAQFAEGGAGFAHGAAGVLWARHTTLGERDEEGAAWLRAAVDRVPAERIGFYDGLHGIAYVLRELGDHEGARKALDRAADRLSVRHCPSLYRGLSGVGLNLLHFADALDDDALRQQALGLADRVTARLATARTEPVERKRRRGSTHAAGLMYGWSGPALFLLRAHLATGDAALLDEAVRAVHRDLDRCGPGPQDTLQVDEGFRLLPYLDNGSAGIALVAAELLRHRDDARLREALPGLLRACSSDFVIESGLWGGRAGLIGTLATLRAQAPWPPETAERYLDRHLTNLHQHAMTLNGATVFPCDGRARISMDVATGGAGVLLALSAAERGTPLLPFLPDPRSAAAGSPAVPERARGAHGTTTPTVPTGPAGTADNGREVS
ncbi:MULTISPECIES: class III lanthionine synthetase LanKC [Streptomyces]|uniref:Class III lanthionine synthetase LanKC n=1 Tax=Streptomyces siderophoricus TaxID=2802281 RepID=A0ABS1MTT5_9ACTN|nr:class III lanthionine synthetase LanKC [Streptomyces sp. 9-7]MBL1091153.1 class III lanthionine synthetase LanKC [Streptomyces sp. 9-7]